MRSQPTSTEYRFDVEQGAVRRFREASRDLRHVGEGEPIPLMFLGAAPSLAGRPHSLATMGFDVARAFHGTETVEVNAQVVVGDRLWVKETFAALPPVEGRRGGRMERASRVEVFTDATGHEVARTTRVILETAEPLPPPGAGSGVLLRPLDDGLDPPTDPLGDPTSRPLGPADFGPLSMADIVRYAAASADLTAIHYDDQAALARRYPGPFAMGMLSAAYLGHALEVWCLPTAPYTVQARFRDQVWPGETLRLRAADLGTHVDAACRVGDRVVTTIHLKLR